MTTTINLLFYWKTKY